MRHAGPDRENRVKTSSANRRRLGVALVALATCVLSACGAGQHAQTADQIPPIDGAYGSVGELQLAGVAMLAPQDGKTFYSAGAEVPLMLSIANNGTTTDTLTAVSSPVAGGWTAAPIAAGSASPSDSSSDSSSPSDSSSASDSSSPSTTDSSSANPSDSSSADTPSATPSSSAPSGAQDGAVLDIAPNSQLGFALPGSTIQLMLTGLTRTLYTAATVPITFTFAKAGPVTINVPVQISGIAGSSTVPQLSGSAGD